MTLISYVFWKLHTTKDGVRQISEEPRFRTLFDSHVKAIASLVKYVVRQIPKKTRFTTPFDSKHVKGSQTFAKYA